MVETYRNDSIKPPLSNSSPQIIPICSHYPVLLDFGYFKLNWIVILLKIISYYPIKNIRNWQPLRYSNLISNNRQNKGEKKNDKTDRFGPVIERLTNTWKALLPPVKEQDLLWTWIACIHTTVEGLWNAANVKNIWQVTSSWRHRSLKMGQISEITLFIPKFGTLYHFTEAASNEV